MKWLSLVIVCAFAFLSGACEMHKASELSEETHDPIGEPHREPADGITNLNPEKEKKAEDEKPGEAPKFFPDKK